MKTRVFIRHCLRDFETQSRFWKRTEKIPRTAKKKIKIREKRYITINEDEYLSNVVFQWSAPNHNGEMKVLMNPNYKWKRDNDSSVKEKKT